MGGGFLPPPSIPLMIGRGGKGARANPPLQYYLWCQREWGGWGIRTPPPPAYLYAQRCPGVAVMIANPCQGRVLMIAFPPPRPSRVTTWGFPSYYTIIRAFLGRTLPFQAFLGRTLLGQTLLGRTLLGRTLHWGYINERASQTYAWTSREPGDIIKDRPTDR